MVSGASGQIGSYLLSSLNNEEFSLGTLGRRQVSTSNPTLKIHEYLTKDYDGKEVSQALAHFKPDVFVNLASLSSVALCEKNPELSRRINLELPSSILEMIARGQVGDCTFIQASSS